MVFDIIGRPIRQVPNIWEDDDDWGLISNSPSGLSISEDESHVYISASLPGVLPNDIEVTFDKGVLWIKGEVKEEEVKKKYYRKATGSFSYRVAVPGEIDLTKEPEATVQNGIMTVAFSKSPAIQPKKISVKAK